MDKDQTTTPGTTCPTLYNKCVGSLTSPANQNYEDAGDGAYGLLYDLECWSGLRLEPETSCTVV